jgi:hypothetical protein
MKFRCITAILALALAFAGLGAAEAVSDDGPPFYPKENFIQFGLTSFAFTEDGKSFFPPSGAMAPRSLAVDVSARMYKDSEGPSAVGTLTLGTTVRSFWGSDVEGVIEGVNEPLSEFLMLTEHFNNSAGLRVKSGDEFKEVGFYPEAELILPAQGYSYINDDSDDENDYNIGGTIPDFRTTKEQLENKCVPYIELTYDNEELVDGFIFRFVDPDNPDVAVNKDNSNRNVIGLGKYEVAFVGEEDRLESWPGSMTDNSYECLFTDGQLMGEEIKFPDQWKRFSKDDIHFIQLRFRYGDEDSNVANKHYVFYEWNIFVNPTDAELSLAVSPVVDQQGADTVKVAVAVSLGIDANDIVVTDPENINMNTTVSLGDDGGDMVSSTSFSQDDIASGGAAVLGKVNFQLRPLTLSGKDALSADSVNDAKNKYSVYKVFDDNGTKIDLLDLYQDQFSLSNYGGYGTLKFEPYVTVVDEEAPENADKRVGDANEYGVKLVGDGKYLLVFDGKGDGKVVDPLALSVRPSSEGPPSDTGGGSSGCAAAFGMLPLSIAMAAAALAWRKKK